IHRSRPAGAANAEGSQVAMNAIDSAGLIVFLLLVGLNALLAAAHGALVNAHKPALREMAEAGDRRAQRVLDISEDATRLLTSRQFVAVILHFFASGILTLALGRPLALNLSELIAPDYARLLVYPSVWVLGGLVMLLFGELIPQSLATSYPENLAMVVSGPMAGLLQVLSPVTHTALWLRTRVATAMGGRVKSPYVTEEEIKTLVNAGSEEGVIEDEAKEMIYSVFQFGDKVAREIMVPRIDIVALDAETTLQEALDTVVAEGHSRIPLYEETIDKVVGVVYAKDLLAVLHKDSNKERRVREIMRTAYFIPESKKAGSLLEEMQQRKVHMAIVIDEYGGTAGLITIEDLVEEIVGEIQDEYDSDEEADFVKVSEDEYLFDASINLRDVNELLHAGLSEEENDTLGGYVLRILDKVPLGGEQFQSDGLEIKVESVIGRRIRKVRVRRLPPTPPGEGQEAKAPEGAARDSNPPAAG
ncbi:MAG TPA: hemolysin family protein, partial [Aggregatilineales bacterium]|nr:hemolysin family protein [Aggregatilineales bacterium]